MKWLFIFFLVVASFANSSAAENDIDVLRRFTISLQAKDYATAKQYVTVNSAELFDRYVKYDLGQMTPVNVRLVSQTKNNQYRYLKVANADSVGAKVKTTNVAFVNEVGSAKIDLPETLRLDFGPNWQQRVDMIEQSYVFAKQNFGDAQSAQVLHKMLGM